MSDLHPIDNTSVEYLNRVEEERIRDHAIARRRLDQRVPVYRIGDRAFDYVARRLGQRPELGVRIQHGPLPGTGISTRVAFIDYNFGTTTARIFAGGPKIEDGIIEVIEL